MVKISWTPLAEKDLEEIEKYIAEDSIIYSIIIVEKIFARSAILSQFSHIGSVVPEFENQNIRELIEGNYRIVYYCFKGKNEVAILRIHHSARLFHQINLPE